MADSKLLKPNQASNSVDLVQCGICYAVIDKPKALPCLHTFCLMCLTSWAQSAAKKNPSKFADEISCPTCRETFPLPSNGVKGLRTNFFVTKLKEKHSIEFKLDSKDMSITCTSCSALGSNGAAVARCVDCNDFLCEKCVETHKSVRVLKSHKLITLDELKSGKLTMPDLPEQEVCSKHKGESLRFHCETCDEPICRECIALDHPQPKHKHSDLKTVADTRREDLKTLEQSCRAVGQDIKTALQENDKLTADLEAAVEKTKLEHMWLTDELKSKILAMVAEYSKRITQVFSQTELDRKLNIVKHSEGLKLKKKRLEYALDMTHQLIQNGSDHDVTTTYASLSHILKQLEEMKPNSADQSLASVKFETIEELIKKIEVLGQFKSCGNWVLTNVYEVENAQHVMGTANSILVGSSSFFYVLGLDGHVLTKIAAPITKQYNYGYSGESKSINGIAVDAKGSCFVTSNSSVMCLDNKSSPQCFAQYITGERSNFAGIAIDKNEKLYICGTCPSSRTGFIRIYSATSCHSDFSTSIKPSYLSFTTEGNIVVSGNTDQLKQKDEVHRYTPDGHQCSTFELPRYARGICCTQYNELFIACNSAIYRYSLSGEYLGVVTKEVTSPMGIALRDDDKELLVADRNQVKVFRLK